MTAALVRMTEADEALIPLSLFHILRRHLPAVALTLLVTAVGVLGYREIVRPPAVAEARVVVENPRLDASGLGASDPTRYFATQLALARLPVVTRNAIAGLGARSAGVSATAMQITVDPATDTIIFTGTLPEGQDDTAVDLANAVLAGYVKTAEAARRAQAQESLDALKSTLVSVRRESSVAALALEQQLAGRQIALREESVSPVTLLTLSGAALMPSARPGLSRIVLVLSLGGGIAAGAVALIRDGHSRRLGRAADAEQAALLPIVARLTLGSAAVEAAEAFWEAITPVGGVLVVIPLADALKTARSDSWAVQLAKLRDLINGYAGTVIPVALPFRAVDYGLLTHPATRAVLILGPHTRRRALVEALGELSRAQLAVAGILWTEPPTSIASPRQQLCRIAGRGRGGSARRGSLPRRAVPRPPQARPGTAP